MIILHTFPLLLKISWLKSLKWERVYNGSWLKGYHILVGSFEVRCLRQMVTLYSHSGNKETDECLDLTHFSLLNKVHNLNPGNDATNNRWCYYFSLPNQDDTYFCAKMCFSQMAPDFSLDDSRFTFTGTASPLPHFISERNNNIIINNNNIIFDSDCISNRKTKWEKDIVMSENII